MNVKNWDTQVELARTAVETAFQVADDMADRIEELEARNKELTLQVLAAHGQAADALDKLAKAVEIGNKMAKSIKGNYYIPNVVAEWEAVLAELEGKA
jgi:hypothetical protein